MFVCWKGGWGAHYGCDLADKRLNLSGIGYPLQRISQSMTCILKALLVPHYESLLSDFVPSAKAAFGAVLSLSANTTL